MGKTYERILTEKIQAIANKLDIDSFLSISKKKKLMNELASLVEQRNKLRETLETSDESILDRKK